MYRFEDLHVPCDWFLVPTEAAGDASIVGWQVSAQNKMSPPITPSSASYLTSILHSSDLQMLKMAVDIKMPRQPPSASLASSGDQKETKHYDQVNTVKQ